MTRYEPTLSSEPYQSHEYAVMEEDVTGEYVKHNDCELLEIRIAGLEKEKAEALQTTEDLYQIIFSNIDIDFSLDIDHEDINVAFQARNLEQQARGIDMSILAIESDECKDYLPSVYLTRLYNDLTSQAKELKEQS